MKRKIVYFATEFPGQTHIFLWREYQALLRLGLEVDLLATRVPHEKIKSHSWSAEAEHKTRYLTPYRLRDLPSSLFAIIKAGPVAWKRIFSILCFSKDASLVDKIKLLPMLVIAGKVVQLAKQNHWSHIHCTTCANAANIAMFASILSPITYSLSLLGPRLETYGSNQLNKWRHAAFGLFQSMELLRHAEKKLAGSLPKYYDFAPVGVNVETMKRSDNYQPWSGNGPCKLYSCGRLNKVKGHEYVIEAVEILLGRGKEVQLTIAGEDIHGGSSYRKVIENFIASRKLNDKVTLLGAVSEEKNREGYAQAHVYVMGSLDEAAGAVAAMEAMCMEVPVVMTNVGATSELIESGKEGLLVESENSVALADAIESVLEAPELAVELGKNGRSKIVSKFNHLRSAEVINEFLEKIE